MDLRAGSLPPQSQQQQQQQQSSLSSSPGSNPFNGTEAIRTNEPNKFITFKDVYDYLSLDILAGLSGSPGNDADLYPFALTNSNYTLDSSSGSLASGGGIASSAVNQSTTFFQNNSTAAWNSSALWLAANGSLYAATTASIGVGVSGVSSNGNGGEGEEEELAGIIVTAATSIILGLMILITVIGECSPGCLFVIKLKLCAREMNVNVREPH